MRAGILMGLVLWILLAMAVTAVTGCSTDSALRAQIAGANIDLARHKNEIAAKPILDAKIPTPDGMMIIVVHAPQGAGSGQVAMPEDPMWRVLDRGMGVLGTAAGIYLGGDAAVGLVNAAGTGIVNALKVQPAPTVVNQPAPVIVAPADSVIIEQPAPVVIEQPSPVIIEQPAPIVIQP